MLTKEPDFKGYIHDVGGPTANFRAPACKKQLKHGACPNKQCLFPKPCDNLIADHRDYRALLKQLRALPGVKKVFIRSGIRFDYLLKEEDRTFLRELCEYHVSGQLKVAPEHVAAPVLSLMGKPEHKVYEQFTEEFYKMNKKELLLLSRINRVAVCLFVPVSVIVLNVDFHFFSGSWVDWLIVTINGFLIFSCSSSLHKGELPIRRIG